VLLSLFFAVACSPKADAPSAQSRGATNANALRPIAMPDVSGAAPPVQTQLRELFASTTAAVERAGASASERAEAYGGLGKLFVAAEFLDAAEPCFSNAALLAPNEMRWPYFLGHVYRLKNDPERAAARFSETLRLRPDDVPSLVWLGEMELARDRRDEAKDHWTRALTLQPRTAAALYGLGRVALAQEDYAQAVKYLEDALALAPGASRIQYPLAMAYRGLGNRTQAESHLRLRGDVDVPPPDPLLAGLQDLLQNAQAYEVRGSEALTRRDWNAAVTNLRKAVELQPENALTRLNLGSALYLKGDAGEALEQFEAAVRLSPGLAKAHYSIGVLMEARGQDPRAIDEFSAAVKSDPGFVEARLQLADALRRVGRTADALPHYAHIIKTDPSASPAHFGYAMALVRLGRYREARERLAADVQTFPDQPGIPHALARLLAAAPDNKVRDGQRALTIVQGLLEKQTTLALAETMAMALAEVGRYDDAASWQRQAIDASKQSGRNDLAARLAENLALYERRQPCRTPWRDDDPVFHPQPPQ
jgi:tetratricopeptide (TPR) repeat protein